MKQLMAKHRKSLYLSAFFFCFSTICMALPDDNKQPIQLQAGSADLNQQTHLGVFIDNVQLDQGTTHIRAARATTEGNNKNQLIKAILNGNGAKQAHYWTISAQDKPPIHAYADVINFYPERHLIELIGHARVEQDKNSFSAPIIVYDIQHQHVISKQNGEERTTIIIHPEHPSPTLLTP